MQLQPGAGSWGGLASSPSHKAGPWGGARRAIRSTGPHLAYASSARKLLDTGNGRGNLPKSWPASGAPVPKSPPPSWIPSEYSRTAEPRRLSRTASPQPPLIPERSKEAQPTGRLRCQAGEFGPSALPERLPSQRTDRPTARPRPSPPPSGRLAGPPEPPGGPGPRGPRPWGQQLETYLVRCRPAPKQEVRRFGRPAVAKRPPGSRTAPNDSLHAGTRHGRQACWAGGCGARPAVRP